MFAAQQGPPSPGPASIAAQNTAAAVAATGLGAASILAEDLRQQQARFVDGCCCSAAASPPQQQQPMVEPQLLLAGRGRSRPPFSRSPAQAPSLLPRGAAARSPSNGPLVPDSWGNAGGCTLPPSLCASAGPLVGSVRVPLGPDAGRASSPPATPPPKSPAIVSRLVARRSGTPPAMCAAPCRAAEASSSGMKMPSPLEARMTALAEQQVQKLKIPMQQSLERGVADAALALRGEQLWVRERSAEVLRQELHSICAEHRMAVREDLAAQRAELLPLLVSARGVGVRDRADSIEESVEGGRKERASLRRLAEQHAQQAAAHSELVKVVLSDRDARTQTLREAAETCAREARRDFSAEVCGLEARISRLEDGHQTQAAALRRQVQALETERKASSLEGADLRSQLQALQEDLCKPASVALCGDEGAGAPASGSLVSISADVTKRLEFGLSRLEDIVGTSVRQLSHELRTESEERCNNVAEVRSRLAEISVVADALREKFARLEREAEVQRAELDAQRFCKPLVPQAATALLESPTSVPAPSEEPSRAVARSRSEPSLRAGCRENDCPPEAAGGETQEGSPAAQRELSRGRRQSSVGAACRVVSLPNIPSREVQKRRVELVKRVMSMDKTPEEVDRSFEASDQPQVSRDMAAAPAQAVSDEAYAAAASRRETWLTTGLTLQQRRVAMIKQALASP